MALALEHSEQRFIRSLLRNADATFEAAVVLVGSAAREEAMSASSDIDIVTIGVDVPKPTPPRIQVLTLSDEGLRKRVRDGDDFAQWALRFGKPLAGRAYWRRLRRDLLAQASWPNHERKREQAAVRLAFADALATMGDDDAASEELRFALSHIARARLLETHVFPLARSELVQQLRAIGDDELSGALARVGGDSELDTEELNQILQLAHNRLRSGG